MVMRLSHLSNYTGKATSLYWIDPAVLVITVLEDIVAPKSKQQQCVLRTQFQSFFIIKSLRLYMRQ